ncbi:hypothetical protein AC578_5908 [Pseudocercospora eumusae]|uniref:Uncharacterized protein n=1 Tax=Pseudocercospora eumusae TaxID=321146 RepID=A0A139HBG0_9PEZI|nr:hypothetical protein AC578_5908 [Pseudocercospora eumusae]
MANTPSRQQYPMASVSRARHHHCQAPVSASVHVAPPPTPPDIDADKRAPWPGVGRRWKATGHGFEMGKAGSRIVEVADHAGGVAAGTDAAAGPESAGLG